MVSLHNMQELEDQKYVKQLQEIKTQQEQQLNKQSNMIFTIKEDAELGKTVQIPLNVLKQYAVQQMQISIDQQHNLKARLKNILVLLELLL